MAENTLAHIGDGATLKLGVSTLTSVVTNEAITNYTSFAQCLTFNPAMVLTEHDVTSMGDSAKRQYIPGHLSATVQATLNLIPYNATHSSGLLADDLLDTYQARAHRNWMFEVPQTVTNTSDTQTTYVVAFRGFITNLSWSVDRDAPNTADMTIRVSDSAMVDQSPQHD